MIKLFAIRLFVCFFIANFPLCWSNRNWLNLTICCIRSHSVTFIRKLTTFLERTGTHRRLWGISNICCSSDSKTNNFHQSYNHIPVRFSKSFESRPFDCLHLQEMWTYFTAPFSWHLTQNELSNLFGGVTKFRALFATRSYIQHKKFNANQWSMCVQMLAQFLYIYSYFVHSVTTQQEVNYYTRKRARGRESAQTQSSKRNFRSISTEKFIDFALAYLITHTIYSNI